MRVPVFILFSLTVLAAFLAPLPTLAQVLLNTATTGGAIRLLNSDQAVLEAGEEPRRPALLGRQHQANSRLRPPFSLRIRSQRAASELAGSENMLTILFRVSSLEPDRRSCLLHS